METKPFYFLSRPLPADAETGAGGGAGVSLRELHLPVIIHLPQIKACLAQPCLGLFGDSAGRVLVSADSARVPGV